jgi:hypothetical protein
MKHIFLEHATLSDLNDIPYYAYVHYMILRGSCALCNFVEYLSLTKKFLLK